MFQWKLSPKGNHVEINNYPKYIISQKLDAKQKQTQNKSNIVLLVNGTEIEKCHFLVSDGVIRRF